MYDVIVVGAGPCGSTAAKEAAKKGARTLLIERKKEIGSPVRCGEGIGEHNIEELGIRLDKRAVCAKINGAVLYPPDCGNSITVRSKESKGYVLDRKVFDKMLAADAAKEGAEIIVKTDVTGLIKNGKRIAGVVIERDGKMERIEGKVVIGADGGESTIARMAGINSTATLYDTDFGMEYEMANVPVTDMIEIYFSNKYAPRGYCWVFPKEDGIANVGVGIGGHVKGHAKEYLDAWIRDNKRFRNAQPLAIKGGIIPVGEPLSEMVADGFIVAGTAAHQVDPIHGGGIALAIEAGGIAGRVAGECALSGEVEKKSLYRYEREWRKTREGKMRKRLLLRKALEELSDDDLNALSKMIGNREIDLLLKNDFLPVVAKIASKRPGLIKMAKALLK
jgi:digeranylgeranylglycerophospholipid reductase